MILKQFPLSFDKRRELGMSYVSKIRDVIDGKQQLMEKWRKAQESYEGKAQPRNWPFPSPMSSTAFLPVTSTHTDAIYARLYNTATGQDPIFETVDGAAEPITGIRNEDFVRGWQQVSMYLEGRELRIKDVMSQALLVAAKYGDALIYVPWVEQQVKDFDLDDATGEFVEVEGRELFGRPVPQVLHPEHFHIPLNETGVDAIQEARWCAYDFDVDYNQLALWKESGHYTPEAADELMNILRPKSMTDKYADDRGDNRDPWFDHRREEQRQQVGIDEGKLFATKLGMYHVWARLDLDGDGFEEEVQFHVHAATGIVPHVTYNPYKHRKRPFVKISYAERDGMFYSIGVPEMLDNLQDVMNQIIRDILDNNKVQNTKVFIARKSSMLKDKQDFRVFPGKMIFVDNPSEDFIPADLGSGKAITSVQDLILLQEWAERRTGITDYNLGQEKTGRTPATTTLALLEEANKRLDLIIRRLRISMEDMWDQILSLYIQFGFQDATLQTVMGANADALQGAIMDMSIDDLRKRLRFSARVTTQNLNRSVRRQESLTMFGQLQVFNTEILKIVSAITQPQLDPALKNLLLNQAEAYHRVIARFLDTFDERDQKAMNPDVTELMESIEEGNPDALPRFEGGGAAGSSNPVVEALSSFAALEGSSGPVNPPGRPVAGQPRLPTAAGQGGAAGPA